MINESITSSFKTVLNTHKSVYWSKFYLKRKNLVKSKNKFHNSPWPSCRLRACRTWHSSRCRSSTPRHPPRPPLRSPARTRSCHKSPDQWKYLINVWEKYVFMCSVRLSPNIGWEGHKTIVVGFLWQKGWCSSCTNNSNPKTSYCNNIIDISIFDGERWRLKTYFSYQG